ncbi:hypothetical protein WJX72_009138 [[Myrmecia] bisecta]|uniref:Uncharacterized protein n=1 Tax=[Myrmecia] bisecta TaxID=41462 RepID=A0AAW1R867_9CHLO
MASKGKKKPGLPIRCNKCEACNTEQQRSCEEWSQEEAETLAERCGFHSYLAATDVQWAGPEHCPDEGCPADVVARFWEVHEEVLSLHIRLLARSGRPVPVLAAVGGVACKFLVKGWDALDAKKRTQLRRDPSGARLRDWVKRHTTKEAEAEGRCLRSCTAAGHYYEALQMVREDLIAHQLPGGDGMLDDREWADPYTPPYDKRALQDHWMSPAYLAGMAKLRALWVDAGEASQRAARDAGFSNGWERAAFENDMTLSAVCSDAGKKGGPASQRARFSNGWERAAFENDMTLSAFCSDAGEASQRAAREAGFSNGWERAAFEMDMGLATFCSEAGKASQQAAWEAGFSNGWERAAFEMDMDLATFCSEAGEASQRAAREAGFSNGWERAAFEMDMGLATFCSEAGEASQRAAGAEGHAHCFARTAAKKGKTIQEFQSDLAKTREANLQAARDKGLALPVNESATATRNRLAQRRVYERRKRSIAALQERADLAAAEAEDAARAIDDNARTVTALEKENQMLKMVLRDGQARQEPHAPASAPMGE